MPGASFFETLQDVPHVNSCSKKSTSRTKLVAQLSQAIPHSFKAILHRNRSLTFNSFKQKKKKKTRSSCMPKNTHLLCGFAWNCTNNIVMQDTGKHFLPNVILNSLVGEWQAALMWLLFLHNKGENYQCLAALKWELIEVRWLDAHEYSSALVLHVSGHVYMCVAFPQSCWLLLRGQASLQEMIIQKHLKCKPADWDVTDHL